MAYVLPDSVRVVDSTAEIHLGVGTLKHGTRVEVLARTPNWTRVRLADGRKGWVESSDLIESESYEKGQQLLRTLQTAQAQASGHTAGVANLRAEPGREGGQLAQLPGNQAVEIFDRQLVDRASLPGSPARPEAIRDAWYLVRAGSKAGWVLGRLISLDIPEAISNYAQNYNLVAWLVLNTVGDNGRQVPQYLVADRIGTQEIDFNHIRVFTWWDKRQEYATAYVESNLNGYFPIRITRPDGIPRFRLRLKDKNGQKYQKVYGMFGTIVRPLGTVEGWESDAMPTRAGARSRRTQGSAPRERGR